MKIPNRLVTGTHLLALSGCDDSVVDSGAVVWPLSTDGFEWPDIQGTAMEFNTVANSDLEPDVKKAAASLKSRYSPDDVTFSRSDLNADGRDGRPTLKAGGWEKKRALAGGQGSWGREVKESRGRIRR